MYIFDSFPDRAKAEAFEQRVELELEPDAEVRDEQDDELDPFPARLTPPVVYVQRISDGSTAIEDSLSTIAHELGGRYVGT